MFEPQPTPFASNSFATYGLATDLDFGYPVSAGGGGAGSLLYTSQPPLPQTHTHTVTHSQQQLPLQLPSPSSSVSSPYGASTTRSQPRHSLTPEARPDLSQYLPDYGRPAIKMEDQGQHDIAAQQAAAKDYRPVLEGSMVGNKTPSDAITQQYAEADQVYVEKTMALPQTYSHYRPIVGDGNCGWRAIGFSYFEKLIDTGDQNAVEGEIVRLMSYNPMLGRVGGYSYFDDWADEMLDTLRMIAQHMGNPAMAHMMLLERWNDASITGSILYYLRLLAATYLKDNASSYEPFIQDGIGGVVGYCSSSVEIPDREIENLGIVALVNILLKPAGFVLEIAYLDRSPGSEVNTYRFPDEANGQDPATLGPIIYLLYRPDHYDILYRTPAAPPVQVPDAPISMQVNRVAGFTHNTDILSTQNNLGAYSTLDYGMLSMIPGLSSGPMTGLAPLAPPPPTSVSSATESYSPIQQAPWMTQYSEVLQSPTPQTTPQQPAVVSPPQPPTPPAPLPPSNSNMGPSPALVATSGLGSLVPAVSSGTGYQIRFSPVQLEYDESKNNLPEPTFQVTTNTFKNSVWNRAHYGNPDFHPEEWSPDDEHIDGRLGSKKKGVKKEPHH